MGAALITACATQPEDLGTTRISPIMYRHMDCEQLAMEGMRVARHETILFNSLEKTADTDEWQMGVGLILLWPVLFALEGGDSAEAAEYSLLKGERDAIEQAAIIKKCGPLGSPSYSSQGSDRPTYGKALGMTGNSVSGYSASPSENATWVGSGASDTCGANWVMMIQKRGSVLRGNMWWGGIKYDVYGKLDATGRTRSARAGKSQEAQHTVGPRFFKLDIAFAGDSARGHYAVANLESNCQANFSLGATKSMPNVTNTSDLTDAKALLDELD